MIPMTGAFGGTHFKRLICFGVRILSIILPITRIQSFLDLTREFRIHEGIESFVYGMGRDNNFVFPPVCLIPRV